MYDEYDDGSDGGSSLGRRIALGVGIVAVAALGWFVVTNVTGGSDGQVKQGATTTTSAPPGTTAAADSTAASKDRVASPPATSETSTSAADVTTTTAAAATTTAAPTTVTAAPTTAAPATTAAAATAPTNPDGTPAWVVAIFDESSITLEGQVPDAASKAKLETLARANAKPGQDATVSNNLVINPAVVPATLGVRIVELTSQRFPDGSAVIAPEQATELDRVVNVMNALPNVTALVIGHADQRGDEVANYVLSKQRADAVLLYMVSKGIDAGRLSSKAVGENELLTLNNDAASLALNKRTEFVLFGLLP